MPCDFSLPGFMLANGWISGKSSAWSDISRTSAFVAAVPLRKRTSGSYPLGMYMSHSSHLGSGSVSSANASDWKCETLPELSLLPRRSTAASSSTSGSPRRNPRTASSG
ncbi:MAG: hypothetical protein ACYTGQ_16740 [Planctomycetota bacterium]